MSTHASQSGARVFLWLLGLTLIALAGFIVYMATRDGGGGSGTLAPGLKDDDHIRGASSSVLVFVEYSDFECPACLAAQPALRSLYAEFASTTTFVYRHLPLSQHKNAELAALASEAAAKQGKFWEMHDTLFDSQREWAGIPNDQAKAYFVKLAEGLTLETVRFAVDMESEELRVRVRRDADEAARIGVRGTPTFYVNGVQLKVKSFDDLRVALLALNAVEGFATSTTQ